MISKWEIDLFKDDNKHTSEKNINWSHYPLLLHSQFHRLPRPPLLHCESGRKLDRLFEESQRWVQIQRTTTLHEYIFGQMRWKEVLFAMILWHDDFCMSPGAFDCIGACTSFSILDSDRMVNLQMFIALISQTVVWVPRIRNDSSSWEDPVLDNRNQCDCVSKKLTT